MKLYLQQQQRRGRDTRDPNIEPLNPDPPVRAEVNKLTARIRLKTRWAGKNQKNPRRVFKSGEYREGGEWGMGGAGGPLPALKNLTPVF